jgi:SAM-dependent methyltransferase
VIMEFDSALATQRILAQGAELCNTLGRDRDARGGRQYTLPDDVTELVAELRDPVLMTDLDQIARLEPRVRDTVAKLYESPRKTTRYDAVELAFEQARYPGVWGPNIDTLLMCRALRRAGLADVRSAVEVGCGSGFIGLFLLKNAPRLERLTALDINPGAVACAHETLRDPRVECVQQRGEDWLRQNQVDLLVCNPPYVPRPKSVADNAYEGVDLLAFFILRGAEFLRPGGRIVVNSSSVADRVLAPLWEQSPLRCTELDRMDVPLKVLNILNNPEWMNYLTGQHGVRLGRQRGYDVWHTIKILSLLHPEAGM